MNDVPRKNLAVCLLLGASAVWLMMMRPQSASLPSNVIEYQGERFKLTREYDDYDEFKNDPNNLAPRKTFGSSKQSYGRKSLGTAWRDIRC